MLDIIVSLMSLAIVVYGVYLFGKFLYLKARRRI